MARSSIRSQLSRRAAVAMLSTLALFGGSLVLATPSQAAQAGVGRTLYVAVGGTDTGTCVLPSAPCATVGYALAHASAFGRVLVAPGTYRESDGGANVITAAMKGLSLTSNAGLGGSAANTIINADDEDNGVLVQANNATVSNLTFENANLEGILVEPPTNTWPSTPTAPPANIKNVTIQGNVVKHNDKAYDTTAVNPFLACTSSPTDSDDCGEGIHLLGATHSEVVGNTVENNVGGILVSDGGLPVGMGGPTSVGPAAFNLIVNNTSTGNAFDCGITLPSHDPRAVSMTGQPQPAWAGVYSNTIVNNVSTNNGGAGLLVATPYPGTGSYNNTFVSNTVWGNGEGGFQLHSHAPQQDVNGNRVLNNVFGTNNTAGDFDSGDLSTTAIILFSAAVPITGTKVIGNSISNDTYGIWRTANASTSGIAGNTFTNVGTDIFTP